MKRRKLGGREGNDDDLPKQGESGERTLARWSYQSYMRKRTFGEKERDVEHIYGMKEEIKWNKDTLQLVMGQKLPNKRLEKQEHIEEKIK